ncbi:hypothetical protein [Streptomyces hoynatensis]|uniref:hypothetical protein n=1 Tax=Streptomyces hoynatensis TaxID=1141874 RepID=UPI00188077B7|nr:hypothetical protein [Streptomyces hoynatensis]
MVEPLATIPELEARLGYTLTGAELAQAQAALADASALVRYYGAAWADPATAPDLARTITLAAAERRVRNPEGYRAELDGNYQYQLPASAPTGVALSDAEIEQLRDLAGRAGLVSVEVQRPVRVDDTWYAPVAGGGDPIPWGAPGDPGAPR